jgi:hypothetical protein
MNIKLTKHLTLYVIYAKNQAMEKLHLTCQRSSKLNNKI